MIPFEAVIFQRRARFCNDTKKTPRQSSDWGISGPGGRDASGGISTAGSAQGDQLVQSKSSSVGSWPGTSDGAGSGGAPRNRRLKIETGSERSTSRTPSASMHWTRPWTRSPSHRTAHSFAGGPGKSGSSGKSTPHASRPATAPRVESQDRRARDDADAEDLNGGRGLDRDRALEDVADDYEAKHGTPLPVDVIVRLRASADYAEDAPSGEEVRALTVRADDIEVFHERTIGDFESGSLDPWTPACATNQAASGTIAPGTWDIATTTNAISGSASLRLFADANAHRAPYAVDATRQSSRHRSTSDSGHHQ